MLYSVVIFSLGVILAQEYPLPPLKIILVNLVYYLKHQSEKINTIQQQEQLPETYVNYIKSLFWKK
jgi:hypothetical protein